MGTGEQVIPAADGADEAAQDGRLPATKLERTEVVIEKAHPRVYRCD